MAFPRFLIYCPVGVKTGGPECLYQLCDALNDLGYTSLIVPTTETTKSEPCVDFKEYKVRYLNDCKVKPDDILVIPEVVTRIPDWLAQVLHPTNIIVWWLSVDNSPLVQFNSFENRNHEVHTTWKRKSTKDKEKISYRIKSIPMKVWFAIRDMALRVNQVFSTTKVDLIVAKHCAQSEYALETVKKNLSVEVTKLSDYVYGADSNPFPKTKERGLQKVIAINPFKGAEYMKVFRQQTQGEVTFIELRNLDAKGISQALSQSDLYMDLGHFPGKDRIPREAILEGCPVFLAKRGAARNEIDFPLQSKFKADLLTTNPIQLQEIISELLEEEDLFESQMAFYNEQVNAKSVFFSEVRALAGIFLPPGVE